MSAKEKNRKRILEVSRDLFYSHGYSKVSMDDLARELGMSKKTLYNHFTGKEELVSLLVDDIQRELSTEADRIVSNEALDFPEKIKLIFKMIGTKLSAINPFFIDDLRRNAPAIGQKLQEYKKEAAFRRFNKLLEEGMKKGYVKKSINRPLAVMLYAAAIDTVLNPEFNRQVPEEMLPQIPYTGAAVFEGLIKIMFEGILEENTTI